MYGFEDREKNGNKTVLLATATTSLTFCNVPSITKKNGTLNLTRREKRGLISFHVHVYGNTISNY
jgi:hypothetical protein